MCRTPSYFINKPLSLENSKISVCVSVLGSAFIHFYQYIELILSLDYVSIGQLPKWTLPMILLRYFADKISKIIWWKKTQLAIVTSMERKSCTRYGTPYQSYNKLTCVCSGCGGILHLRSELLRTIRGSNGFYIKDPNQEKYYYEVVENIQDVATKFWVKVQSILTCQWGKMCVG